MVGKSLDAFYTKISQTAENNGEYVKTYVKPEDAQDMTWENYVEKLDIKPIVSHLGAATRLQNHSRETISETTFYTDHLCPRPVNVPIGKSFHFWLDGRICEVVLKEVSLVTSYAAIVHAKGKWVEKKEDGSVEKKDDPSSSFWIKCSSLGDYFEDISMEIKVLNALSLDPFGKRLFPRVVFYQCIDSEKKFMMFATNDYRQSLEDRLRLYGTAAVPLHCIRVILQQILQTIVVLQKYGIRTSYISTTNIRMQSKNTEDLRIIRVNLNRAVTTDKPTERRYCPVGDEYTPIDTVFGTSGNENIEVWSVAAIAFRMLVGQGPCAAVERYDDAIVFGAHRLLGAPTELDGFMETWYKMGKEEKEGELVWRKKCQKKYDTYVKRQTLCRVPKSIDDLVNVKPTFYKSEDQIKDLEQLVKLIKTMLKYKERPSAVDVLQDDFFVFSDQLSEQYKSEAGAVCNKDEETFREIHTTRSIEAVGDGKQAV